MSYIDAPAEAEERCEDERGAHGRVLGDHWSSGTKSSVTFSTAPAMARSKGMTAPPSTTPGSTTANCAPPATASTPSRSRRRDRHWLCGVRRGSRTPQPDEAY